jgi:parallel beta helix pectate lyase-like protein
MLNRRESLSLAGAAIMAPFLGTEVAAQTTVPMPALTTGVGLAKRPVFNATTSTLSWQGPMGGGPSNGDYTMQSRGLTSVTIPLSSVASGAVIEGLDVQAFVPVAINHNNVTIRQCRIRNMPFNTDGSYGVMIADGVTGTIIEDCLLDGNADSNEGNCVSGPNIAVTGCTIRRCTAFRTGQLVRFTLNNVTVTECYCHKVAGADADFIEVYPNGGVCNHLLFQYNVFRCEDNSVQGANSGINLSTGAGLPGGTIGPDVVIDANWFVWVDPRPNVAWQSHSINNGVGGAAGGNREYLQFRCTNNGIYNVQPNGYGGDGSTLLGAPSDGTGTIDGGLITPCSGNYVMATPTSRTGAPYPGINGPGQL